MNARWIGATCIAISMIGAGCAAQNPDAPPTRTASPRNPAPLRESGAYTPDIRPENFVDVIDNPYMPLEPGTKLRYEGESDGEKESTVYEVTEDKRTVMGVETTVVRDRVYIDGELAEDTFDWFAQDRDGNVWYFGEESKDVEGGKVVSTAGSWEAGVDGAQPGVVMLGSPRVGDEYRQEFYEGEAEDAGRVIAIGESVTVAAGSYDDVLITEDWNPLEPKVLEQKYYARGVGVVKERHVKGGEEQLELVAID